MKPEDKDLLIKDESLGSPDYERGFKHGRDYQTEVTRKYTNKDKVIAYLVDKGYPISTAGEIPTYQETFDMVKNAIEYSNKQEHQNLDDIKREWYNKGYLKGRKEAHIPARELGLPKALDFKPLDEDLERDAVNFCFDNGLNTTPRIAKTIAKHFYELGRLNVRKEE